MTHCFFWVSVAGNKAEKIVFKLENNICPKTCENFTLFCKSTSNKSYKNTIFHRIIPGFMVQGGDYENGDGTGGEAFAGGMLEDECFDIKHDGPFVLSMANRGVNTAGSQFFITLGKASHLDGKHVAFGRVVEGMEVLRKMEKVETDEKDKPINMQKIKILDSGIGYGCFDEKSESDSLSEEDKFRKSSEKKLSKKLKKSKTHDSSTDEDYSSSSEQKHRTKKHRKKSKDSKKYSHKSRYEKDDSSDDSSHHKKKRKHKNKYHDDDESDRERKHRKKHKKRSRQDSYASDDNKSSKRRHKDKKSRKRDRGREKDSERKQKENSFGKFGIIKESDLRTSSKLQRNFEIWLEEVKGIPQGTNVPKWEMSEYFKEYAEDFNTATLPHEKYYDYDKWEVEEYNRKREQSKNKKGPLSDEFEFQEERQKQAEEKRRRELELVRMTMSKEKIEDMKRQSRLKSEMVNAYRVGDEQTRKKLQKKLEPDEK